MALVDIERPTVIRDPRLIALFQLWDGKRAGRRMPSPDDLDASDMTRWADHLMLIDIPGHILDFRVRWPCSGRHGPAPASKP